MNRILFTICILSAALSLRAQNTPLTDLTFHAGIVLGLNASQVDGDDYAGYNKLGINAGFMSVLPVSKKIFFSAEILYTQKGSKSHVVSGMPLEYRLKLNYAEIPVLFNFNAKPVLDFGAGFAYARLVKSREFVYELEQPPFEDLNKNEFAGLLNANYFFNPHFFLNVRFSYSLAPIGHSPVSNFNSRAMFNNLLSFRIGYIF